MTTIVHRPAPARNPVREALERWLRATLMAPISFNGEEVESVTMDGDEIEEITLDGDTVFTRDDVPDSGVTRYEFEDDSDTSVAVDSWEDEDTTAYDLSLFNGPQYVTGKVGSLALQFDATDDRGETGSDDDVWTPSGDFTIVCWINPDNSGYNATEGVWNVANDNDDWAMDCVTSSADRNVRVYDGSDTADVGTDAWVSGEWQQFAFGRDGSTLELWRNGSVTDSVSFNTNHISGHTNSYPLELGVSRASGDTYYGGVIDDFRWYTTAPSNVVSDLYDAQA